MSFMSSMEALLECCHHSLLSLTKPEQQQSTALQPVYSSSLLVDMMRPDGSSTIPVLNEEPLSADLAHEMMGIQVAALQFGQFYDMQYVKMYTVFMAQLQTILPPGTNIPDAYANGSSEEQAFIQNLALFFTSFFKCHIRVLESTPENRAPLLLGLEYLIWISYVDDTEVFKVCLDYWNILVLELFEAHRQIEPVTAACLIGLKDGYFVCGNIFIRGHN